MTGLEATFVALSIVAFGATAWVTGIVLWRVLKAPKR
jgi:hypothetical protein